LGERGGLLAVGARLRDLGPRERGALVGFVVLAAALRVVYQAGRPFTGDEVGTLLSLRRDYGYLLTHFDTWLTMNYYLALAKALAEATGGARWALVSPSFVAGIAVVPLVAALGLRVSSRPTALVAALLAAVNPYLIVFGVQIRSYMLLIAFLLGALVFFYDWAGSRLWRHGAACAACAALALLLHANAIYPLVFFALLGAIALRERRTNLHSLAIPMAVALGVAGAAYLPLLEPMLVFRVGWSDTPPTSWGYLPEMVRLYFGRDAAAVPSLLLLGLGAWSASQSNHRLALLGLGVLIPMALASLVGVAVLPWAFARFLIPVLPLLLLFEAEGAVWLARSRPAPAALVALLVAATWAPGFAALIENKRDYPLIEVARYIEKQAPGPGELLPIGNMTKHHLMPYFDERTFVTASAFVRGAPDRASRLLVVSPDVTLRTASPQRQLGKLQVVTYRGDSRAEIALTLLRDLHETLGRRVSPKLTEHYALVLDLLPARASEGLRTEYTALYWKCYLRTRMLRFAPPHLLKLEPEDR
jgi:hypothetical protein